MKTHELLPCAHCGHEARRVPRFCMGYAGDGVECPNCHAATPSWMTEDTAVKWWNRRAEPAPVKESLTTEQPEDGPVAWLVSSRHNGIELYDNEHDARRDFDRRCRDNDEMVGMDPLFPASAVIALQAERDALRAENDKLRERVKELEADAAMLDQMQDECWNVECEAYPIADSGDSDIEWRVFSSHMAEPRRREIGYGRTPREALNAAMQEDGNGH